MSEIITERVDKGAAFLDEHDPDWWKPDVPNAIDINALALRDPGACVLGQRCPVEVLQAHSAYELDGFRYFAYARHLSGIVAGGDALEDWADGHGFALKGRSGEEDDWDDLTDEWVLLIADRRAAAAA